MSLVYVFRRLVFVQVLMGILAFCIAERNPGMLLVAGSLCALSWYVAEGPSGKPMPQWVIHLGALAAVVALVRELQGQQDQVLLAMGHFTMWLQILQMYGKKSNREYGLILVLSLLQMVGASILNPSLFFGLALGVYCLLLLFTVLVFQFKATADLVREGNTKAAPENAGVGFPKSVTSRGFRWQFRFAAMVIGLACATAAAVVFVLLPRTSRYGPGSRFGQPMAQTQVGFTNQVRLDGSIGSLSHTPVLNLTLSMHGSNVGTANRSWLLRGAALDYYDADLHTWTRSRRVEQRDVDLALDNHSFTFAPIAEGAAVMDAQITLRGGTNRTLVTLYPYSHFRGADLHEIQFNPLDQQLTLQSAAIGPTIYNLRVPLAPPNDISKAYETAARDAPYTWTTLRSRPDTRRVDDEPRAGQTAYASGWRVQRRRIRGLAVSVLQDARLLQRREQPEDVIGTPDGPRPDQVASALAEYLRSQYQYSLTNPGLAPNQDPIVEFLFIHRQGHCELFAAALAAMTRSVGLQARVITGFRAAEYNAMGGYYVVRQSNAHAWTEVYCGSRGWRAFDATPPDELALEHQVGAGWWMTLRQFYEHMEFNWLNSFVAYDNESRAAVFKSIGQSVQQAASDRDSLIGRLAAWIREMQLLWKVDRLTYIVAAVIVVFIGIGIGSLIHTFYVRRKRWTALQLTRLPRRKRQVLARQLGFYLQMLDMLERHGHRRPPWQTPFGFAEDLQEVDGLAFSPVMTLTEYFYEVRFGHRVMHDTDRAFVREHLKYLEHNLVTRRESGAMMSV